MKKISSLLSLIVLSLPFSFSQELQAPAVGKALVIFTRSALDAPIIKFSYFDNDRFLGKIGPGSYVAYECDPGKHLFWGKSENRDFLEAELEADQIYLIETKVKTGLVKARIQLLPYGPKLKGAEKFKESLLKRIAKRDEIRVSATTAQAETEEDMNGTIEKGLAEYQKRKDQGKKMDVLTADMHI
ncbi:hypothetical protein [Parapedobacter sp.]